MRGRVAANGEGRADLQLANGLRAVAFEHRGDDVHGGDDQREQIDEEPARLAVPSKELSGFHDPPHAVDVRGNGHYSKAHDEANRSVSVLAEHFVVRVVHMSPLGSIACSN